MLFTRSRGVVGLAAVAVALAAPALARADAVTDWSVTANAAIIATTPTAHAQVVKQALVNAAVYDAVNSIAGGFRPYLASTLPADPMFSQDAAAAAAAYRVSLDLAPTQATTLANAYTASLAKIADGPAKAGGIAVGEHAAAALLAARANDGRGGPFTFVVGTTPGAWRPSPPFFAFEPTPWVGNVTPFLVPDAAFLRTDGPNALTSKAYTKDYDEVKSLGSLTSTTRTPDQTMAAIFWQSPPGILWGGLLRELSARFDLTTAENARLFAIVGLAQGDAAIGCWNDKYYWNFWRPIDAIRNGDDDGNPETKGDPDWKPLFDPSTPTVPVLSTPAFPDHPSGHSCQTGATMKVLRDFFHTDRMSIDITGTRFPTARHFDSFSAVTQELIGARVWGGIHFRTADVQGVELGEKVARYERAHFFKRTDADDDEDDD